MSLDQWTVVAAGNASLATGINWAEGQAPSTVNDSARQMMADLRAEAYQSATVVAAATTDLATATGSYVPISGNTTITGLGTLSAGMERKLRFTGTPLLVHNGTSLILPGGANIQTIAGDMAHFVSEGGGNWRCLSYRLAYVPWTSYTATLTLVGGAGNTAPTYTGQSFSRWMQVGKMVFVDIDFTNAAGGTAGAGTGQLTVALPVAVSASGSANGTVYQVGAANNASAVYLLLGSLMASATTMTLNYMDTIATAATFTGVLQNNGVRKLRLSFSYPVD